MHRIQCKTLFDVTATGIKSYYKSAKLPITDNDGNIIKDETQWLYARNQQRNWETVNQVISLRTLPEQISLPVQQDGSWVFEFQVPSLYSIGDEQDPVKLLKEDANGVPMIVGLGEKPSMMPYLASQSNIWFELLQP